MILFDLIVSQNTTELSKATVLNHGYIPKFSEFSSPISKSLTLAYLVKNPEILTESKKDLAKKRFVRQNYWQKLFNTVWHQVIFLSVPSKVSDKYIIELNYLNAHQGQNSSKNLVSRFSKSLIEGSISSSLSSDFRTSLSFFSSIQYAWAKSMKLKRQRLISLLQANAYQDYIRRAKTYVNRSSSINHFPLFTVSNHLGQMIISEPPNELKKRRDLLDYVLQQERGKQFYQGWFFTSFEDAQEYMDSITRYYGLEKDHLKLFACNFSAFYSIVDRFRHQVCFRILPDLAEISSLIKNYRHLGNISFHKNQKYSSTYFQGQPLYMLKVKDQNIQSYNYNGKESKQHSFVFSSYKTACSVLSKIHSETLSSKKNKIPDLLVYNLESFIQDSTSLKKDSEDLLLLVPSQSSYWFTKKHLLRKRTELAYDALANYASCIRLWSKRIVWSLTSKNPHNL